MFTAGNHNIVNSDILFTIKDTKNVPVVILSAKDNQKLSKLLSKKFKKSLYWNKYKTKSKNTLWHTSTDNFLNQILSSSIESVSVINPLSNHSRLIADDFSPPKDLDSDPKAN